MDLQHIEAHSDEEFVRESVGVLRTWIEEAISDHDSCIIGLSGGSTPRPIYNALGKESLDWEKVWIFLVDERYTNAENDDSNQKLVREALLMNASIPEENLIFPGTSLPLDDCIIKYSVDLKEMIDERLPDIITLGLGEDGHIASLFPPLSDLTMGDERLVLHTTTDQFAVSDRITVSLNFVTNPEHQVFFLKGGEKKAVWEEMLKSDEGARRWPAKAVLEEGRSTVISLW